MADLAFVDTETTGLNADVHAIWEAAVILGEHTGQDLTVTDRVSWFVTLTAEQRAAADPEGLQIGRFYERTLGVAWTSRRAVAESIQRMTAGRHIVGAVPNFDTERLERMLRACDCTPRWHYHLIDVENLAVGYLARRATAFDEGLRELVTPPWNSDDLTAALGVTVPDRLRHTAMGDADWAMRTYAAVHDLTIHDQEDSDA